MKVFLHNTVAVVQEQFIYQFEVWWFDLTALQLLTLLAVLYECKTFCIYVVVRLPHIFLHFNNTIGLLLPCQRGS